MPTVTDVHHINFLVRDIEASRQYFSQLLGAEPILEKLEQREALTARYSIGTLWIVLVQPLNSTSTLGSLLAEKGEGMFLLSLRVDSLPSEQQSDMGEIALSQAGPRQGLDDWQVWDLQTPTELGAILQICQSSK